MLKIFLSFMLIGVLLFTSGCSLVKLALGVAASYGIAQAIND